MNGHVHVWRTSLLRSPDEVRALERLLDPASFAEAAEAYARFVQDHPDYKPRDAAAPGLDEVGAVLPDHGAAFD